MGCATKQRDELASFHSITSSARASNEVRTVPNASPEAGHAARADLVDVETASLRGRQIPIQLRYNFMIEHGLNVENDAINR